MKAAVAADNVSLVYDATSADVFSLHPTRYKTAASAGFVLLERGNAAYNPSARIAVNPLGRAVNNRNGRAAGFYILRNNRAMIR